MLKAISELVAKLPWSMIILFCLTLGLAPFFPIPRAGKIKNVFFGNPYQANLLVRFNNACCTTVLLLIKIVLTMKGNGVSDNS